MSKKKLLELEGRIEAKGELFDFCVEGERNTCFVTISGPSYVGSSMGILRTTRRILRTNKRFMTTLLQIARHGGLQIDIRFGERTFFRVIPERFSVLGFLIGIPGLKPVLR